MLVYEPILVKLRQTRLVIRPNKPGENDCSLCLALTHAIQIQGFEHTVSFKQSVTCVVWMI